ncbi:MAG: hypothetical protein ABFD79_03405 [Phycisphaerales bacterium]
MAGVLKYFSLIFVFSLSSMHLTQVLGQCNDFEIDGTYEASIDIPRIYFLLKHTPAEPPIPSAAALGFELNYAFLDTGASGILLSRETADDMLINIQSGAQFVDTGVGGDEFFDVSEPLYVGTLDFNADETQAYNPDAYRLCPQYRFQISREYVTDGFSEPIDVLGMPVMAGKVAVLKPIQDLDIGWDFSSTSADAGEFGQMYFTADIKDVNDSNIPAIDFQVALRFEKYINPSNPGNVPPLPVLAYNPVIDNVTVEKNGLTSSGNLLFDTGGTVSIISVAQGMALGLVDANGDPIVDYDFSVPIGGIGGSVELPGFTLDRLTVPTLNGFNLVYLNARVCVHDIGILDEDTGDFTIIDGIFGDNFICASMNMETWDVSSTPYDNIVVDTRRGILGFDVNPAYTVPACTYTGCGSISNPRPAGDFTGDCEVDFDDLQIAAEEWLKTCDWLNFRCRGADMVPDGIINFKDFNAFINNWFE